MKTLKKTGKKNISALDISEKNPTMSIGTEKEECGGRCSLEMCIKTALVFVKFQGQKCCKQHNKGMCYLFSS